MSVSALIKEVLFPISWAMGFIIASPLTAAADTIKIRSGEHPTFSRLVIDLDTTSDWDMGRSSLGYEFRLARDDVEFDTSRVFRMIPKTRLSDLNSGSSPGSLDLILGCECHAVAFSTSQGSIVIDIVDGAAPAGSKFENSLNHVSLVVDDQAPNVVAPPVPQPSNANQRSVSVLHADPNLALFWRGVASKLPSSQSDPSANMEDRRWRSATSAEPAPNTSARGTDTESSAGYMVPDTRVSDAQDELLRQLSRAAAQGLVDMEVRRPTHDKPAQRIPIAEIAGADSGGAAMDSLPTVKIETSIDRDTLTRSKRQTATASGGACLPNSMVDVASWGDSRPAYVQIAERRLPLVAEFDRPSLSAVMDLAKLYLYLGFGAETRSVLDSFDVSGDEADILRNLGAILEGEHQNEATVLLNMSSCNSAVALWAVLEPTHLVPSTDIDEAAVLLAFSALPLHLRRHLGPELSERFLSVGRFEAAHGIRDAIARAPGHADTALDLIDAQIDLANGDARAAERNLDALALQNNPISPTALAMTIASRLERGEAVDAELVDTAEALAFERQDGNDGPRLQRLHILARASNNDFEGAFAAYNRWTDAAPIEIRHDTARRLFKMLAEWDDDDGYLKTYFSFREAFRASIPDLMLTLDTAERLANAGFVSEVRSVMNGEAAASERGRRILARAALSEFNPVQALKHIDNLHGSEVDGIRVAALSMAGDHRAAAALLTRNAEHDAAGREAWRAGYWPIVADYGPDVMRDALRQMGLVPAIGVQAKMSSNPVDGQADPKLGSLAAGRELVEGSRSIRAALEAVIASTENGD